jgi:thioredoxin 1
MSSTNDPSRADIDATEEPLVLEFGTSWCGHCAAAQALIGRALAEFPKVRHLKIEDGPGRRLGRTYGVKLWPTLVFLSGGKEVARLVRPAGAEEIVQALASLGSENA